MRVLVTVVNLGDSLICDQASCSIVKVFARYVKLNLTYKTLIRLTVNL
jgi:hypothetical protein